MAEGKIKDNEGFFESHIKACKKIQQLPDKPFNLTLLYIYIYIYIYIHIHTYIHIIILSNNTELSTM